MGAILIAESEWYGWLLFFGAVLKVVIGLGFVIFVHELGHFLVAKLCGVRCEKFYVGFDVPIRIGPLQLPSSLCKFQWGETEYGIGTIPLGGYVKMLGQDDNPANAKAEAERIRKNKEASGVGVGDADEEAVLDPRSYPAKSVPKRMAIISAGVIMNLIFALVFAVVAFRMGVEYRPAVIGGTSPGSDAWVKNLKPGGQIIQIGKQAAPSDYVRWIDMLREVFLNGGRSPLPLLVRYGDAEVRYEMTARKLTKDSEFFAIGIHSAAENVLADENPVLDYMPAGRARGEGFQGGDKIIAINGQPVDSGHEINTILARHPDQPLSFRVERKVDPEGVEDEQTTLKDVQVGVNSMRGFGLQMEIGPITAIQNDSPAAEAGFQEGDIIRAVNGEPVQDPMLLDQRVLPLVGQTITVNVEREGKTVPLTVTPVEPLSYPQYIRTEGPIAVDEIGVAFTVTNTVAGVTPGSPADKAGIQPGDLLVQAAFDKGDEELQEKMADLGWMEYHEPVTLGEEFSWPTLFYRIQQTPPELRLNLTWSRAGVEKTKLLSSVAMKGAFYADRGLRLNAKTRIRQAQGWSEALGLGYRETVDRFGEVLRMLRQLFTGKIGVNKLAGPAGIVRAATHEAHDGIPQLLMFLTMLSVNLAIVNFLPVPVLDGGHMMFLTWELVVGKPVDENIQMRLSMAGLLLLLVLFVVVTFSDIQRFFS